MGFFVFPSLFVITKQCVVTYEDSVLRKVVVMAAGPEPAQETARQLMFKPTCEAVVLILHTAQRISASCVA